MLRKIIITYILIIPFILAPSVLAILMDDGGGGGGGNTIEPVLPNNPASNFSSGSNLVGDIITKILPIAIGLGGFLTVIFIIISGIQFISSSGNPEAATAAKNRLTYAIVGFVILALSFLIVRLVNTLFLGSTDF